MVTPSIKDALRGIKNKDAAQTNTVYNAYTAGTKIEDKQFNINQLKAVWEQYSERYKDEIHLYQTLTDQPITCNGTIVTIEVENSVQLDQIKSIKPEITGFLRRELDNSHIELDIREEKAQIEKLVYTSDQKMQKMMEKNPELAKLRNLFQLDINS